MRYTLMFLLPSVPPFLFSFFHLFFLLVYGCSVVPHHLLKRLWSFIELPWQLCKKSMGYTCVGLFLASLFCFIHVYSWPSLSISSTSTNSVYHRLKTLEKSRNSQKAKLVFACSQQVFTWRLWCIYNYLRSIYIVLSIISSLDGLI